MYTEGGLLREARQFLNNKCLFNSNLMENKQFAFESIQNSKFEDVGKQRDELNSDIDGEVESLGEVQDTIDPRQLQTRSRRFRSTGFEFYGDDQSQGQARTINTSQMRKTKYKIRSLKSAQGGKSVIKFGSTKNLRKKMGRITKSISKLHNQSQSNWSKKDLKAKYLPNGSNFKDIYNRSTHTLFDQVKTQQIIDKAGRSEYGGIITGSPYIQESTQVRPSFAQANQNITTTVVNGKVISNPVADKKNVHSVNQALNNDQKVSYLNSIKNLKYAKTDLVQKSGGKSSRVRSKNNLFKDFGVTTKSKLRNHEGKRPQTSAVNHSRDLYDPLTRARVNKTSGGRKVNQRGGYNKSQTISGFAHLGRVYAPNFSREYQKAYGANSNGFRKSKGM